MWYHWRSDDWTTLRCLATSHTYLLRQVVVTSMESLNKGVPFTSFSGDTEIAVSNPPWWAEMPRGCLFPDLIPNRNVSQRYLAKLTREGSYSTGGFHCLSHKDRSTWGYDNTVHIYYIHIQTVVREINKGLRCVNLEYWSCLPLEWDWSLLELSPHWEPTREVDLLTTPYWEPWSDQESGDCWA